MINPSNYSQGSQKHHTTVTMPFATSWFYQQWITSIAFRQWPFRKSQEEDCQEPGSMCE